MAQSTQQIPVLPIDRPSSRETLEDLYNKINTGAPNGIRWHLASKNSATYAWGYSARVGVGGINGQLITTLNDPDVNARGYVRQWQPKQFAAFQPLRVTSFNRNALEYSSRVLSIDTARYGTGTQPVQGQGIANTRVSYATNSVPGL